MLGRYALFERIAKGGMASVHLGRLLGPVGFARTVAIKRMHEQFADDPAFVSMFLDEARLTARIRHPNVVPALDVVAMKGELFLVMEFIQGESLSQLIRATTARGERIPPEVVAAILVGALHGLHAAHEARDDRGEPLDIVHRDVSPHNIIVGTDGVSRVLDFGIARAVGRLHQTTQDGRLKGKLAYMAPEQVAGVVGRTTDVYGAAVVLWEALTGQGLFRGENEAALLQRVLLGCSVPPSAFAPDLPPVLDAVTMRGLSLDPAKRFPTARDMARALEEAVPPATTSRVGDWVEAVAKETLVGRSTRIASIESDETLLRFPQSPPEPHPSGAPRAATASSPSVTATGAAHSVEDTSLTVTGDTGASSRGREATPGARVRRVWLALASGVLALLVSGAALLSRHSIAAKPSSTTRTAPELPPSAAQLATGGVPAPDPPAPAAPDPAIASTGTASLAPTGAMLPGRAPARTKAPSPGHAPARPAAPTCTVVTIYDTQGDPHFKKVCK
jgi:serine/threonine-protein kinase